MRLAPPRLGRGERPLPHLAFVVAEQRTGDLDDLAYRFFPGFQHLPLYGGDRDKEKCHQKKHYGKSGGKGDP